MSEGLKAIVAMPDFNKVSTRNGNLQAAYFVALHGQTYDLSAYFRDNYYIEHLDITLEMLRGYAKKDEELWGRFSYGTAIFEGLKVINYAGQMTRSDKALSYFKNNIEKITQALKEVGTSKLAIWKNNRGEFEAFIFNNVMYTLNRPFYLFKWGENVGAANGYLEHTDATALNILERHDLKVDSTKYDKKFLEEASLQLATAYIKATDRDMEKECTSGQFAPYCTPINVDNVFRASYSCPSYPTVKMRIQLAADVSQSNIDEICDRLQKHENHFKSTMGVSSPIADDKNETIELIIFASGDDWKTYGGPLFDMDSNNGGIYIEGEPEKEGNQARFYAYISGYGDNFDVWNLEHEFTHYLDGRYNMYGRFGHYEEKGSVWWSEGIAEYMAHKECFARGLNNIYDYGRTPSLQEILDMVYSTDYDMTYSWSYTVHRYMNENGLTNQWKDMAAALRKSNREEAISDYKREMQNLIYSHSSNYDYWIKNTLKTWWDDNQEGCSEIDHSSH